jgi:dCMP deaminase
MSALWDGRFLTLANQIGSWSKDTGAKVGAVIVDPKRRIVSVGYNGFPQGVDDSNEIIANREVKLLRTIHAEENAILFARRDLDGCSIYVNYPPCAKCAAKIIQVGITNVYSITPDAAFLANWKTELDQAHSLFVEAGVNRRMLMGTFK